MADWEVVAEGADSEGVGDGSGFAADVAMIRQSICRLLQIPEYYFRTSSEA
jgi:hypothetical protein